MKELKLEPNSNNLQAMIDFVSDNLSVSEAIKSKFCIACDEILSNIIYYSGASYMKVGLSEDSSSVTVVFSDNGTAFDPLKQDSPDISADAAERKIGGLGIFMVKNLMDEVTYKREGSENVLSIKKIIQQ